MLSPEAFNELKLFITQYDEWNKNLPRFKDDPEPTPMLPKLEEQNPFLLFNGYKFSIILAEK
jgi:hypothetical protein